ncbi:hypothetical protein ND748_03535 [Frankia sp. AiPs1]|uniref:hypothetical protein n=1 Tax=Frankia sp. AiPs1 TaxID=573493 RepID=UPI0020438953|nr:hypothetical protein [Frankia sp. AiPs1]MCM3920749.1 hypothetical protein [Frankia sp. AiPs1]
MSDEVILHDGDEIAQKVPMLSTFRQQVTDLGGELADTIARNNFAKGAKDEVSLYAESSFQELMDAFGKIYGALGEAVGLQGDRLSVVRQIGDTTEGETTEEAGWESPGGHHG